MKTKNQQGGLEEKIAKMVIDRLRINAKKRAQQLRSDARHSWLNDRPKYYELKAKAKRFDDLSEDFKELIEPWEVSNHDT